MVEYITMTKLSKEEFAKKILAMVKGVKSFKPHAFYNEPGNCIEVFLANGAFYGDWINHDLTVYRSMKDHKIIGMQINGIKKLIEAANEV